MIEARQMAQKETSCSLLATFHQPLKRSRFSSSCFIIVPVEGCASGSPVSGDWIFGTYLPMPKPFSRIQLDCTRLFAPPAPANTRPASSTAISTSPIGSVPRLPALSRQVAPGRDVDRRDDRDRQEHDRQADLEELRRLQRLVDHGRGGQRHGDGYADDDRDGRRVAADEIRERGRARRAPAGPDVRARSRRRRRSGPTASSSGRSRRSRSPPWRACTARSPCSGSTAASRRRPRATGTRCPRWSRCTATGCTRRSRRRLPRGSRSVRAPCAAARAPACRRIPSAGGSCSAPRVRRAPRRLARLDRTGHRSWWCRSRSRVPRLEPCPHLSPATTPWWSAACVKEHKLCCRTVKRSNVLRARVAPR